MLIGLIGLDMLMCLILATRIKRKLRPCELDLATPTALGLFRIKGGNK